MGKSGHGLARGTWLVAMVAWALASTANGAETLRWKFLKGEAFDYVLERRVDASFDFNGNMIHFGFRIILDMTWQVRGVDGEGTAEIGQTVNRIQIAMKPPTGAELRYDSTQPEPRENPLWGQVGPRLAAMLGETFSLKVSATGTVTDVVLPKKLADEFAKDVESAGQRMGLTGISADGIKSLIEKSFFELPAVVVGENDTWNQRIETKLGAIGTQVTDLKYTYQGKRTRKGVEVCDIDASSLVTFVPSPDTPDVELEISEQNGSGLILFDATAGRTRDAKIEQRLKMVVVAQGNEVIQNLKEGLVLREGKSPEAGSLEDNEEKN